MATIRFPENISENGTYIVLTRYNSQGFTTKELRNIDELFINASPISSFGLPVPNELNDSSSINYSDTQDTDLLGLAQQTVTNKAQKEFIMADIATGTTNPNIATMLFNGVSAKSFNLTWNLIPENNTEANNIISIIKGLEEAKLPYFTNANQRLKFPDIFRISFGGIKPKMLRFLPSVITNMDINYSNGHFQIYKDGNFPQIQLTITFTEIVSRTREMQQRLNRN
jgi:hypothetical protein